MTLRKKILSIFSFILIFLCAFCAINFYPTKTATQNCTKNVGIGGGEELGDKLSNYVSLKYTDKTEYNGGGLFAATYKWDRIETVEDFIANENKDNIYHGAVIDVNYATKLTDEAMTELKGKEWVLRFAETNYQIINGTYVTSFISTFVGDVTILRLKFETDDITYNLGVVDNKQTGSKDPSNETDIEISLGDKFMKFVRILALILLIILLLPVLPYIIKIVTWFFKLIVNFIKKIIGLFKKKDKGKNKRL